MALASISCVLQVIRKQTITCDLAHRDHFIPYKTAILLSYIASQ